MARCGCSASCACVVKGDGTTTSVTGNGSPNNPYVVTAETDCADVRECISADPESGVTYDPTTGVIGGAPGSNVLEDGDATTVEGSGTAGSPWTVNVNPGCGLELSDDETEILVKTLADWGEAPFLAFPCDETNGEPVFCDSDGNLRVAPPFRTRNFATEGDGNQGPNLGFTGDPDSAGTVVCPGDPTYAAPDTAYSELTITNPSPCRQFAVLVNAEGIIGFTLSEDRPNRDQTVFRVGMLLGTTTPLIAPPAPGANNWEQLQQNRPRIDVGQQLETMSITPWALPITLPPGGSITVYAAMWASNEGNNPQDGCFTMRASRTRISAQGRSV